MIHLQTELIEFSSSTHWLNDLVNKPLIEKIISEWQICSPSYLEDLENIAQVKQTTFIILLWSFTPFGSVKA